MSEPPPVRIFLRPLGSPLTLGMSGLAIASLVQSGVELHWTPRDETVQAGLILIAVPFVLQLLACILSYMARDGATGAAVGVLATSWLAIGLIHIAAKPGVTSGTLGLLLVASGGVLLASASAIASAKPLPGVIFAAAALRFAMAGVYQLSKVSFWSTPRDCWACSSPRSPPTRRWHSNSRANASGQCCPTFRRGRAAAAIRDGEGSDRHRLVTEPGVRGTT